MSRHRYGFDEARTQRFIAERRGTGEGATYLSWLRIQDVPSLGRSHRPYGIKTGRRHDLLSDGEWKCFLMFESSSSVVDIREGYPMNRYQTSLAARALGYRHPTTRDGTPYVMTVDFVITRRTPNGVRIYPYTFKYDFKELSKREEELIQIAEEFWRREGYVLERLDSTFFDETLIKNYDEIRSFFDIASHALGPRVDVRAVANMVRASITLMPDRNMTEVCQRIASLHGITPLDVFNIVRHLIARGGLHADLRSSVPLARRRMHEFSISHQSAGEMGW